MKAIDLCNTDDSDNDGDQLSNIKQQKKRNVQRLKRGSDDDESIISISSTEEDKKIAASYKDDNKKSAVKNKPLHRKRRPPKRLRDVILKKAPQLKCERSKSSSSLEVNKKNKRSIHQVYSEDEGDKVANMKRRARDTCYTDVEYTSKPMRQATSIREKAIMAVAKQNIKVNDKKLCSSAYEEKWDEWWYDDKEEQLPTTTNNQSQGGLSIPVSLVSFDTLDDQSATSEVTIDITASSSEAAIDLTIDDDSSDEESSGSSSVPEEVIPQHKCRCVDHHQHIVNLLNDWKEGQDLEAEFCIDFIGSFKQLLQGIEDDCNHGRSIFFHENCELNKSPNPLLTVVKLIQLFEKICDIAMHISQFTQETQSSLLRLLFKPWRNSSPNECGVIVQVLYISSFDMINSRDNVDNLHQLVGATFGLQLLNSMARNTYRHCAAIARNRSDASFEFLEQPFQSYDKCIKRDCEGKKHCRKITCTTCGLKFHKGCIPENTQIQQEDSTKCCPTCQASTKLSKAAEANKLADIYSLVVQKGASPFQSTAENFKTALHIAIQTDNYELLSMLLYGAYILLNCDDSLSDWELPSIAWPRLEFGKKALTPFEIGIESIITNMNSRPPVETLLLLCNRGAHERPKDIQNALEIRQKMLMTMKGIDSITTLQRSDISSGLEPDAIPVIGDGVPSFMYVAKNIETRHVAINWFECREGKSRQLLSFKGQCCPSSLKLLHQRQKVRANWQTHCNYLCESRESNVKCKCQRAEDGVHTGLEVFKTSNRGYGVRTAQGVTIRKHEIVCHYAGEIISATEAKKRDEKYSKEGIIGSYILDCDEKGEYCIDATNYQSLAALVNHSCGGTNCELVRIHGSHLDDRFPTLVLKAKEDIGELTELNFNYTKGNQGGDKPTGHCSECNETHCLCQYCCEIAHKNMKS